jgi:hypothetical protein
MAALAGCPSPAPPPRQTAAPPCEPALQGPIAPLRSAAEILPDGVTEDAALDAVVQFLAAAGHTIEAEDRAAHTVVTERFPGHAIPWTCDTNEYRNYAYRISVSGHRLIVDVDCWRAIGWPEHVVGGKRVPADRGADTECLGVARYGSKLDATVARDVIAGTVELLRRRAN